MWLGIGKSASVMECLVLFVYGDRKSAGYTSLGCHLWSLNIYITLYQDLLSFIVSIEKTGIILLALIFYVTWSFSCEALNSLSLFCVFSV